MIYHFYTQCKIETAYNGEVIHFKHIQKNKIRLEKTTFVRINNKYLGTYFSSQVSPKCKIGKRRSVHFMAECQYRNHSLG